MLSTNALAAINGSEIDRQIATAKQYPRDYTQFRKRAHALITLDPESAAACIYALPRGMEKNELTGKWEKTIIKGPTISFAVTIATTYGNNRYGARIIAEDEDTVTAQGSFFDLE